MADIRKVAEELIRGSDELNKELLEELKTYEIDIPQRERKEKFKLWQRFFRK